jgi:hypothetical protein
MEKNKIDQVAVFNLDEYEQSIENEIENYVPVTGTELEEILSIFRQSNNHIEMCRWQPIIRFLPEQ